jgi:NAD+ synthase
VLKHHLPNDAVFDEKRVFASADVHGPYVVKGVRIGTPICEDAWHPDVAETLAETGAEILLIPNGSPYHRGKPNLRLNLMVSRVVETGLPLVYLNMVGGQDDQVFDGSVDGAEPRRAADGATAAVRRVRT